MPRRRSSVPLYPRSLEKPVRAGLALLLGAYRCAQILDCPAGEVAIAWANLQRIGWTEEVVQALLEAGQVECENKATQEGNRNRKSCRGAPRAISELTLTEAGAAWAAALLADGPPVSGQTVPEWDEDRRELRWHGQVLKRFRRPAPNQVALLRAFEDQGWPERIANPLPAGEERYREAKLLEIVKDLNRGLRGLRFSVTPSRDGVCWQRVEDPISP